MPVQEVAPATVSRPGDRHIAVYLPTGAGQSFSTNLPQPHALSPWLGLGVMVAWVAVAMAAAAAILKRSDA